MNIKAMYRRFSKLTWRQQLGNLAVTLARISTQATSPESDKLVSESLREAALLIEWSAPNTPAEFLMELAAMQREALAWHRCWPIEAARPLLALHSRHQSERLLKMAGLLPVSEQAPIVLETSQA